MLDDLVPIGRFATITRLSVKALRHYHDLGLLEPARIDDSSGYRYYRLGQANRAEAIRVLRHLDLPLDEIRTILDGDPEVGRKALAVHADHLADELARHERMLEFTSRLLAGEEQLMPYEIEVVEVPVTAAVAHRASTDLSRASEVIGRGFGMAGAAIGAAGIPCVDVPFCIFHDIIDEETPGDLEVCLPVPVGSELEADGLEVIEIPGGSVARTIHRGPYDEVAPAYHAVATWIREHGHEHAGPPREAYLNDPTQVPPDELLTRIDFPIR